MAHLSWLHLTDLHLGMKPQRWLWPGVREIFFEDIKKLHDKSGPWDLVLFTGDLTQQGKAVEFQEVDKLLDELWNELAKLGSSPKLLAVPGNHDLIRPDAALPEVLLLNDWPEKSVVQDDFWRNAKPRQPNNSRRRKMSPYQKVIEKAFKDYCKWWERNTLKPTNIQSGILPGDFAVTIEKDDARFGIIGLNTSFLQLGGGNYEGKLAIHALQFHEVCGGDGPKWAAEHHTCLLLTHHPVEWLDRTSQQFLTGEITDHGRFAVHACGHRHEAVYQEQAEGGTEARRFWQSRSLFGLESFVGKAGEELQRSHGYTVGRIELDRETGKIYFWPRESRLQGNQRNIVPDFSVRLTDDQHTEPRSFALLRPYSSCRETRYVPFQITSEQPMTPEQIERIMEAIKATFAQNGIEVHFSIKKDSQP
jgi:predicted MPP superfamily phosphohydrolase